MVGPGCQRGDSTWLLFGPNRNFPIIIKSDPVSATLLIIGEQPTLYLHSFWVTPSKPALPGRRKEVKGKDPSQWTMLFRSGGPASHPHYTPTHWRFCETRVGASSPCCSYVLELRVLSFTQARSCGGTSWEKQPLFLPSKAKSAPSWFSSMDSLRSDGSQVRF